MSTRKRNVVLSYYHRMSLKLITGSTVLLIMGSIVLLKCTNQRSHEMELPLCNLDITADPREGCVIYKQTSLSSIEIDEYAHLKKSIRQCRHVHRRLVVRFNNDVFTSNIKQSMFPSKYVITYFHGSKICAIDFHCRRSNSLWNMLIPITFQSLAAKLEILSHQQKNIIIKNILETGRRKQKNDRLATSLKKQRQFLIFTSSRNPSYPLRWQQCNRRFDVFVNIWENSSSRFDAENVWFHKGSKFQALYSIYHAQRQRFLLYDFIAVWDDDLVINCTMINHIFDVVSRLGSWVAQPAFTVDSRISHTITKQEEGIDYATTSFVEMNAPIFSCAAFHTFMNSDKYDGSLFGWGIDFLYHSILGQSSTRYHIIHNVTCKNPHEWEKSGSREINLLASAAQRKRQWDYVRRYLKIHETPRFVYRRIAAPHIRPVNTPHTQQQ